MWSLLSEPSRRGLGPTLADFRRGAAPDFADGIGTVAGNARVVLARLLADGSGVAAIAGEQEGAADEEKEYAAYGAALVREAGRWKLDYGSVAFGGLEPEPGEGAGAQPEIRATANGGGDLVRLLAWLDGRPLALERTDAPFTATLTARPSRPLAPGRHTAVAFATTEFGASAVAWAFEVE
jgi:hypothetical protein